MKKLAVFTLLTLIFCGCAPVAVDIAGNPCKALTEKQIARLVIKSRLALKNNVKKGLVTAAEAALAAKTEPTVEIRYRGDCYGTAFITWRTRQRIIGLRFDNALDADMPTCALAISTVPDATSVLPDKSIRGR